jgi:hypothetical protein
MTNSVNGLRTAPRNRASKLLKLQNAALKNPRLAAPREKAAASVAFRQALLFAVSADSVFRASNNQ